MSRIETEKLIYKKPSLTAGLNGLVRIDYSGEQEEEPIVTPTTGTTSKDTGDLNPTQP